MRAQTTYEQLQATMAKWRNGIDSLEREYTPEAAAELFEEAITMVDRMEGMLEP